MSAYTTSPRRRAAAVGDLASFSLLAEADAPADLAPVADASTRVLWEGPVGFEGVVTGDGRLIEHGALRWPADLSEAEPLDFRYVSEDVGFHDGAVVIGHIVSLERISLDEAQRRLEASGRGRMDLEGAAQVIWARGDIVTDSEVATSAAAAIADLRGRGVSMDLDEVVWEARVRAEIVAEADAFWDALEGDEPVPEPERREVDGYVVVAEGRPDDEITVMTAAEIRTATGVSVPAFAEALIGIVDAYAAAAVDDDAEADDAPAEPVDDEALVAAAAPVAPPRAWFDNPGLSGPTPLTVTEDGRVFGHAATFDECHIASPAGADVCVLAPRSRTNYARFHLGSLLTAEGDVISVGKVTMGTGHASANLRAGAAAAHYDDTGAAVADVRAGEDEFGIWLAGSMRPEATEEQVRALRASPISGDWRKVDGHLEMVAALAVNVPGFPVIPRPAGLVASGELATLVASGIVLDAEPSASVGVVDFGLSEDDLAALRRLAAREIEAEGRATRARVEAFRNRSRVEAFAASR